MAAPRGVHGRPAVGVGGERVSVRRFWGRPGGGCACLLFLISGFVVFLMLVGWAMACFRLFSQVECAMLRCHVYTRGCDKRGVSVVVVLVVFYGLGFGVLPVVCLWESVGNGDGASL